VNKENISEHSLISQNNLIQNSFSSNHKSSEPSKEITSGPNTCVKVKNNKG
jgi:hypothetical protein